MVCLLCEIRGSSCADVNRSVAIGRCKFFLAVLTRKFQKNNKRPCELSRVVSRLPSVVNTYIGAAYRPPNNVLLNSQKAQRQSKALAEVLAKTIFFLHPNCLFSQLFLWNFVMLSTTTIYFNLDYMPNPKELAKRQTQNDFGFG